MRPARSSPALFLFSGLPSPVGRAALASAFLAALAFLSVLAPAFATEEVPSSLSRRASEPASAACAACHTFDPSLSHPTNISPRGDTPAFLPLENGKIACTTCHDPALHRQSSGSPSLRNALAPAALCATCHSAPGRAVHPHTKARLDAHLRSSSHRTSSRSSRGVLDSESQSCMSCHDGTLASDAGSHRALRSLDNPSEEHPMAVAYASAGRTLSEMKLLPQSRLDPRIRLFNGNMGCGSCHSPYSRIPNQLVMSNNASKLCLSCHHDR